ncbi:hypothetical protein PN498_21705 [Oscillatoria sp. CS-180]|uniref:hypothetical protein n=1 Tax=Oscillatoria sp. CS-180 TaxID=3021720 RepID=UPI00232B1161|nr:hypothetical protein [Oscillatoria sp. CS-180]MDB9528622.1 hypothetical protein [Oscillatoria sp. CS-180]
MQLASPKIWSAALASDGNTNQRLTHRQSTPVVRALPILGRPTEALRLRATESSGIPTQSNSLEESS